MSNILITGCAGFIGSSLCELLLETSKNDIIIGIDNFDPFYSKKTKLYNMKKLKKNKRFLFYEVDILNQIKLKKIKERIDLCIHLAAKPGVVQSINNPKSYLKNNLIGTSSLIEFLRYKNVKKIIFASSSSIYRSVENQPFVEGKSKEHPLSPYGLSKLFCEYYLDSVNKNFGVDIVKLRLFSVYGPRMRPDLAIYNFTNQILKGKTIKIYGDGSSSRDYTYIDDVIIGIKNTVRFIKENNNVCETINLGKSQPVKITRLIEKLSFALSKKAKTKNTPSNEFELNSTFADITKAKKLIGYQPKIELTNGIEKFVKWYYKNHL